MNLEVTILSNLCYHEKYARKVLPFLMKEYFTTREYKIVFLEIHEYISQLTQEEIKNIYLTASGGPFRNTSFKNFKNINYRKYIFI